MDSLELNRSIPKELRNDDGMEVDISWNR